MKKTYDTNNLQYKRSIFYDLIIFMRGPGAQRKKITALFGRMKDPIGF